MQITLKEAAAAAEPSPPPPPPPPAYLQGQTQPLKVIPFYLTRKKRLFVFSQKRISSFVFPPRRCFQVRGTAALRGITRPSCVPLLGKRRGGRGTDNIPLA